MGVHPLVGDLSKLTNDELHSKYAELTRKMSSAYRLNMGDAIQQMQIIIMDYQSEIQNRNEKMMAELSNKSAEFKHIIDVK